ncbi:MAG: type IV toxin-antitoxin system AbiEi family antitoxin [Rhodoglobus sp.]
MRFVEDSTRMLSDWAAWHRTVPVESTGMHMLWDGPRDFVTRKLAPVLASREWAVTGWLAADLIAPFVTEIPTVSVYVARGVYGNELASIADRVGLRRVESGPRVIFMPAEPQVFEASRVVGEIHAVSPIRLYGDLLRQQGRGVDAAEHLRDITIGW